MRCGKTEELVKWVVDIIIKQPDSLILVAAANPEEGHEIMTRIRNNLRSNHADQIEGWKFSMSRVRTTENGHIDLFASRNDRVMRGYKVDEFMATEGCDARVIETGKWTERRHDQPQAGR